MRVTFAKELGSRHVVVHKKTFGLNLDKVFAKLYGHKLRSSSFAKELGSRHVVFAKKIFDIN